MIAYAQCRTYVTPAAYHGAPLPEQATLHRHWQYVFLTPAARTMATLTKMLAVLILVRKKTPRSRAVSWAPDSDLWSAGPPTTPDHRTELRAGG